MVKPCRDKFSPLKRLVKRCRDKLSRLKRLVKHRQDNFWALNVWLSPTPYIKSKGRKLFAPGLSAITIFKIAE
ncbi:hypothetical protein [uncultured Draconibacterium sp.]|uniref:hypothetical protein n=1 Tax=uncultured Draconibacterium sp. TaxID=1573823 RepID=UPI0025E9B850|nr:hypothetical protein [uncultured Draconibacterium sp.]